MAPSAHRGPGLTHILVLTAVEIEARGLARHLDLARVSGPDWPNYRGGALEVVGVGLRAAYLAERLAHRPPPSLVVSAGVCGALAPDLPAGALVVPEVVIGPAGEHHAIDATPGLARRGRLLSVDALIATPAAKARLWLETGALAVDLESATIVEWARRRGVAVAVVRAVADTARDGLPADLAAVVEPGGRVRAGRALRAVLARPRAVADALALGRNTEAALRSVAAALGTLARTLTPV